MGLNTANTFAYASSTVESLAAFLKKMRDEDRKILKKHEKGLVTEREGIVAMETQVTDCFGLETRLTMTLGLHVPKKYLSYGDEKTEFLAMERSGASACSRPQDAVSANYFPGGSRILFHEKFSLASQTAFNPRRSSSS